MTEYKVTVDRNACIGCGSCPATCEKHFELKDDGKSHLKEGNELESSSEKVVNEEDFECVKSAADGCPVNAIHIENKDSGDKII